MIALIVGIWLLNFAISWFNAWACGKSWNETKHVGGVIHFMNWMGAIMSAMGFTWCYMLFMAWLGATVPFVEQDDGTYATLLTPDMLEAYINLGYLVVIGPILGSGLAITCQSWYQFAKRRTLGNAGVAGWNTFAQIY